MKFQFIGQFTVTECKDGSAMVSTDIEGDQVIIKKTETYDEAVREAVVLDAFGFVSPAA